MASLIAACVRGDGKLSCQLYGTVTNTFMEIWISKDELAIMDRCLEGSYFPRFDSRSEVFVGDHKAVLTKVVAIEYIWTRSSPCRKCPSCFSNHAILIRAFSGVETYISLFKALEAAHLHSQNHC